MHIMNCGDKQQISYSLAHVRRDIFSLPYGIQEPWTRRSTYAITRISPDVIVACLPGVVAEYRSDYRRGEGPGSGSRLRFAGDSDEPTGEIQGYGGHR